MPELIWKSKTPPSPIPAELKVDSEIYPKGEGYPAEKPDNQLIFGDNLRVMSALIPEYEGCIDLIYADPPFFTNRRYAARIGRGEDSRQPKEWQLTAGYPDRWPDLDTYLEMLYSRLFLMYRLLSTTGTMYLHLDWHANAYARLMLDEIFGAERLLNEIVWIYHGPSPIRRAFNRKHDTILAYSKSREYTFNVDAVRLPYDPVTVKTFKSSPKAGFGKVPDLKRGKVPEDWWYFPVVARLHNERTGYPTQKPEGLLQRIILTSSNPGNLVADFFCGSGTAAVVAARQGRRFLVNDDTWMAIHTTRSRLVEVKSPPFTLKIETSIQQDRVDIPEEAVHFSNRTISLPEELLQGLDYWEVDPAWDGHVFHSAVQATRPRRKGRISQELTLPDLSAARTICVRMIGINGEKKQVLLDVSL